VIVDAHHHLWDPAARAYPWMTGAELAPLRRPFGVSDLRAVAVPAGVGATVVVQAVGSEEETRWLLRCAESSDGLIAGVVGWTDVSRPGVGDRIAALSDARLVGLRHQVHDEPDPSWLLRADVVAGLSAAAAARLTYDLLIRPRELPAAVALARRLPELRLVVDHGAKPEIAHGGWEPWSSGLAELAACENVWCKLSGLVTEARLGGWREDQIERYIDRMLGLFGTRRLLFGSDWPVCTLAASYQEVLELARAAVGGLSASERDAVFTANALEFYGLGTSPRTPSAPLEAESGSAALSSAISSHASTPAT
jgi:L-fuconolactonase